MLTQTEEELLLFVFGSDGFQVFGFKYLTAIQTFEIIDAIPAGDNLGTVMVTGELGLHKAT